VFEPRFNLRKELRFPYFNPTTMVIITLYTVDVRDDEGKASIVGNSFFPIFLNRDTKNQPVAQEDAVYCVNPRTCSSIMEIIRYRYFVRTSIRKNHFSTKISSLMFIRLKLDKLPCASILIRIRSAPKQGFTVLKLKDFPASKWQKLGLWPKAEPYSSATYCNTECRVNDAELKLFETLSKDEKRKERENNTITTEAVEFSIKINEYGMYKLEK
jgi:hypothetical protein